MSHVFIRHLEDSEGSFVYQPALRLARQIDLTVLAPHAPDSRIRERMSGMEIRRFVYFLPSRWERLGYRVIPNLRASRLARIQLVPFLTAFLLEGIRASRSCDLLHAHWTLAGFIGICIKKTVRKPLVLTVRGTDLHLPEKTRWLLPMTRWTLDRADELTTVSEELRLRLIALGVPGRKITVIPNGVDTELFHPASEPAGRSPSVMNVIYVGRFSLQKGTSLLKRVMEKTLHISPHIRFTLVGSGELHEELVRFARRTDPNRVRIVGPLPQNEIPSMLRQADVLVHPSTEEGRPNVILEAMASGLPVVATRVGGIPELVEEGATGLLTPLGETDRMTDHLLLLQQDPALRKRMGEAARAAILRKNLTWEACVQAYLEIYRRCLRR
jgi:glycosyltransferase involved in cell wall biosynthesis